MYRSRPTTSATAAIKPNTKVAENLPNTTFLLLTGEAKSVSKVFLSFSPATESLTNANTGAET